MNIDVIIPSRTTIKTKHLLSGCINSLFASEKEIFFNVVIIESAEELNQKYFGESLRIRYPDEKFVYNKALNIGINATNSEWIVLANNDLIFNAGWFSRILDVYNDYCGEYKSFSPWNNMYSWHESIYGTTNLKMIPGYSVCRELCGWCIVCRREIFDIINLSEEVDFWYSDNIYGDALIMAGIKHALVVNSKVDHITSQTHQVTELEAMKSHLDYCNIDRIKLLKKR